MSCLRAWVSLFAVALGFRVLGFARMLRLARRSEALRPSSLALSDEALDALAADIARAAPWAPGRCLYRAWLLHRHLCRRGQPARLRIGVELVSGQLAAHAWVECRGRAIAESGEQLRSLALLPI